MADTPFKALLVEGTSGAGKSTLIDGLLRRHAAIAPPRKIRTLVHLAQSHTYGPLAAAEDRGTLTADENARHIEGIVQVLEWLHACVQEHDRPWCFALIDTLHLTHCVRPGVVQWSDVERFDGRLAAIGCKLIFLEVSPLTLWERGIQPRMNNQFILQYSRKFGRNPEEIHRYFLKEQRVVADLFARSSMSKLKIAHDCEPETVLEAAYRFWIEG